MPTGLQINPHLHFDGRCEEALRFYAATFGGEITMLMPFGGTPMAEQAPADWGSKVVHATMQFGDQTLTGADAPPERYQQPQGFSILLQVESPDEAQRIFSALEEGALVLMTLQPTFWALQFAMLVDRFNIPWTINCGTPAQS